MIAIISTQASYNVIHEEAVNNAQFRVLRSIGGNTALDSPTSQALSSLTLGHVLT
jgi:hypothetical protein